MTHASLRGEMYDGRKSMRIEQLRHGLAVGNIHLREFEIGERLELRDPSLLETRIIISIEVIDAHYLVPVCQQAPRNVHADESGRTSDENRLLQARSLRMDKTRARSWPAHCTRQFPVRKSE